MIRIKPGQTGRKVMPHSEVCIHMRIAGKEMDFLLKDNEYPSVQLYKEGQPYSGAITTGEAGLFWDSDGYYYYANDHGGS